MCTLVIPDAAAPLEIKADLRTRCITVSMKLLAPGDRKSAKARVNWLVRMLAKSEPVDTHIRANWPGRSPSTQAPLSSIRENPDVINASGSPQVPGSFEVFLVKDIGGRFSGRRTFIEELEALVPAFYENVGQRLSQWQPPAPKIKVELTTEHLEELDNDTAEKTTDELEAPT